MPNLAAWWHAVSGIEAADVGPPPEPDVPGTLESTGSFSRNQFISITRFVLIDPDGIDRITSATIRTPRTTVSIIANVRFFATTSTSVMLTPGRNTSVRVGTHTRSQQRILAVTVSYVETRSGETRTVTA